MISAHLIFPHQLFENHPLIDSKAHCYLVEVDLFFTQYPFHQQKIAYHRAAMKAFADENRPHVKQLTYIEAINPLSHVATLIEQLAADGVDYIVVVDVVDDWLNQQLLQACDRLNIQLEIKATPMFLSSKKHNAGYFKSQHNGFFHHNYYQRQRREFDLLMNGNKPVGGKWSFDEDNRKKYPKDKQPPALNVEEDNNYCEEARHYVSEHFKNHLGYLEPQSGFQIKYPINHQQAISWLDDFLAHRFEDFGIYEDAIVKDELVLNHSVLTPMLNVGLLTPQQVIGRTIDYAKEHDIPINSVEGFIRQIIGWREFIRGLYEHVGVKQRTQNHWGFSKAMPKAFYDGSTGIVPVDDTIHKLLDTGYCHHIERLMILGNFMLLCEIKPDAVYQWFMELFIDAYDWVMVPNVYGMSQFADGGLMATKPYISSSNYILKMSDYSGGKAAAEWRAIWDGLFWRFMAKQRDFFEANPRIGMLLKTWDRMSEDKQSKHLETAENFLKQLK